jgi:hypothetical protein
MSFHCLQLVSVLANTLQLVPVRVAFAVTYLQAVKPLNCTLNLVFKPRINSNFLKFKSNSSLNLILNHSLKSVAI